MFFYHSRILDVGRVVVTRLWTALLSLSSPTWLDKSIELLPGNAPLNFCNKQINFSRFVAFFVFFEAGGVLDSFLAVHRTSSPGMVWNKKQFL